MKKIFFLFLLVFISSQITAQVKVALHHNGTTTMFSGTQPFVNAYDASVNGDTIYLPGGVFTPPPVISKGLVIIGAGHYPDSTLATGITDISVLNIYTGADRLKLQGMFIAGGINFEGSARIDSVVFYRCYMGGINYSGPYDTATNCRGHLIYQNVIGTLSMTHTSNIRVFNNIISSLISMSENAWIKNNKIESVSGMTFCFFENNAIRNMATDGYNTFRNNIFENAPSGGTNIYLNNYNNNSFTSIFQTLTAWFSYTDNYHLINPGAFPGTDGTQAGIYGGLYPYKDGAVPSNPHIRLKSIGLTPEANGKLKVNFTVAAQNN